MRSSSTTTTPAPWMRASHECGVSLFCEFALSSAASRVVPLHASAPAECQSVQTLRSTDADGNCGCRIGPLRAHCLGWLRTPMSVPGVVYL